jgi:hypothetical protein
VVGDLAGFVASIFYRGIPFVQIPTTIVAQVDSSVGGKTGVNVGEGKNLLGAFHQPRAVFIDPETLGTLPDREFREGFAEAIKHAAIRDAAMLDELAALDPNGREVPAALIARNIAIKARIVEADEHETLGIRALLNFGHTIGHGIEASLPYGEMLHGEAISLGIRAALFLSERHAGLSPSASAKVIGLLEHYRLPLVLNDRITTDSVMEKLARDKKFSAGAIRFVVLDALGNAKVIDTVTTDDLREAIDHGPVLGHADRVVEREADAAAERDPPRRGRDAPRASSAARHHGRTRHPAAGRPGPGRAGPRPARRPGRRRSQPLPRRHRRHRRCGTPRPAGPAARSSPARAHGAPTGPPRPGRRRRRWPGCPTALGAGARGRRRG